MKHIKLVASIASALFIIGCSSMKSKSDGDKTSANNQAQPKLTKPVARRIWIEPQVTENGSVYIEGHWKYVIEKESAWTN